MGLNIRILTGKRQGEEFKVRAGITIGRRNADLSIRDAKMSSRHAAIEEREGRFFIVDQGSRNKILVDGSSHSELSLEDGSRFTLGETDFEIFYTQSGDLWEEQLSEALKEMVKTLRNKGSDIHPFQQDIRIDVVAGPDRGQTFPLGYGPRQAGKDRIDLFFQEHFERTDLFLIDEDQGRILFKTKYPDLFTLNDSDIDTEVELQHDDIISFGKTQIKLVIEK